jgi:ABC-type Fe3+-hydroxamate transport system substrate-binding protein
MPLYHDQLGRDVNLPAVPKRIISIVPSQTELLFYLGLDEEIIGITKFCTHPADKFKATTKIGGTKQLDIEKIKALKPDLIIGNKEENEKAQVEALMDICPVWISDISNLAGALDMIERVGAVIGKAAEAKTLAKTIQQNFDNLKLPSTNLRAAYLIWRKPYMVAGKNTFIDHMLQQCGLTNAFADNRYPEIDNKALIAANPDVILLSSEPYPFRDKHITEFKTLVPTAKVMLVDGEMFSWYGNRLLYAPSYFFTIIGEITKTQSV